MEWSKWPPEIIETYRQAKAQVEPALGLELAKKHAQRVAASAWAKSEGVSLRWMCFSGRWLPIYGTGKGPNEREVALLERMVEILGSPRKTDEAKPIVSRGRKSKR